MNLDQIVENVHEALWADGSLTNDSTDVESLEANIRPLLGSIAPLASAKAVNQVIGEVQARVDGLGPLHAVGADTSVTEIMVNSDGWVWVERAGRLERTGRRLDPEVTMHLIRRLASHVGRTIDLRSPSVDVRLVDGSRLHAIIPPLSVDGPCVTIRRFASRTFGLDDLAEPEAVAVLRGAVQDAKTIIVAGGTSSGKTTMLNALAAGLDPDARIITIEDAAELQLPGRHVIRLETRRATETSDAVTLRDLARHALRMRPDRIVCGEMRGSEALDLVQAMNTGHDGSMSTVHANTPADALRRIETMMLLGDADLPLTAIRDQLASCIDLVVMVGRGADGQRAVQSIGQVARDQDGGWSPEIIYSRSGVSS